MCNLIDLYVRTRCLSATHPTFQGEDFWKSIMAEKATTRELGSRSPTSFGTSTAAAAPIPTDPVGAVAARYSRICQQNGVVIIPPLTRFNNAVIFL